MTVCGVHVFSVAALFKFHFMTFPFEVYDFEFDIDKIK